jgi:cysteine-rich repeat protein
VAHHSQEMFPPADAAWIHGVVSRFEADERARVAGTAEAYFRNKPGQTISVPEVTARMLGGMSGPNVFSGTVETTVRVHVLYSLTQPQEHVAQALLRDTVGIFTSTADCEREIRWRCSTGCTGEWVDRGRWAKRQGRGEDVKEDTLSAIFTEYMMWLRHRNVALFALSALPDCGNGLKEAGEACDDGNRNNSDACNIELAISDFGSRANAGKLKLEELQGGTFTISNGGVYGSLMSTPIINPPQSGILGMHSIQERPVGIGGKIELRPMMYIALSYDHRIVDG